jgi:hypothetical protein
VKHYETKEACLCVRVRRKVRECYFYFVVHKNNLSVKDENKTLYLYIGNRLPQFRCGIKN